VLGLPPHLGVPARRGAAPPVNKKRMWRLMREHSLLVPPNLRLQAKRTAGKSTPQPTKPHAWWGIEMTKVLVHGCGWISIVVVLEWYTKALVGNHVGRQRTARHWLSGLDMAVNRQFPEGVQGQGLSVMRDNGCQPTSTACMRACGSLGLQQALTSANHPQGNADTERAIRTLKEACLGRQAWTCPVTLAHVLTTWIDDDNEHDLHSSLGYKPPKPYGREYYRSHGPQLPAA
jgi:putative transposase